jgi:hypothetical protein
MSDDEGRLAGVVVGAVKQSGGTAQGLSDVVKLGAVVLKHVEQRCEVPSERWQRFVSAWVISFWTPVFSITQIWATEYRVQKTLFINIKFRNRCHTIKKNS